MCGRYVLKILPELLQERYKTVEKIDYPPRFNIAPTQPVITVLHKNGLPTPMLMRWGLIPGWVKDPREFPLIINARAETIMEKPSFRGSLRHHRCIIPADGYYEWRKGADGKKQPYYISMANDEPMAFAGVWTDWMGDTGEEIDTAAIVTVAASSDIKHIHERMPAFIGTEQIEDWLDVKNVDAKQAKQMLLPLPEGTLKFHPVSTRVNSAHIDGDALIDPVTDEKPKPVRKQSAQGNLF